MNKLGNIGKIFRKAEFCICDDICNIIFHHLLNEGSEYAKRTSGRYISIHL